MKVRLVSKDLSLYRVCREALIAAQDRHWDLAKVPRWQPSLQADLWIWDCDTDDAFPPECWFREEHKIIFVLDRKKIAVFRDLLPVDAIRILLKPVRPDMLRAFVEQILTPVALRGGEDADPIRGEKKQDSDVLLQHVLEANLWLQEYEKDLTGFLAQTAHDLGAPLVTMSGYCGLLLDRRMGPLNSKQLSTLEKMQRSAKRMSWLTDGMTRISMGRDFALEPMMKPGDIQQLISEAVSEVQPVAESKQLKLHVDVTPAAEPLLFEFRQIEHVLVNLLDHACRWSSRGGSIDVKAFPVFWDWRYANVREGPSDEERRSIDVQKPNAYRVEVRETAPGLNNGRGRAAQSSGASGGKGPFREGIGLAICRHVIFAHNGQVLTEQSPQGPILGFVLPLVQRKARQAPAVPKTRTAG